MVERDPSDVPPTEGGPPYALLTSQQQVLRQLRQIKTSLTVVEKWVKKQAAKGSAKSSAKKPAKKK
jgi:hypothetical protein